MEGNNPNQPINNDPVGFPGANPAPSASPSKKNWKWLVVLILFLVVIGAVTYFVFKSSKSVATNVEESSPTPDSSLTNLATPVATSTATPTPAAVVDKAKLNVSILNGTGIAGEAGILSDQLKNLGYTNITTGNAPTQNATSTEVTFSSSVSQDVITEITTKLKSIYTSVTTGNSTLPSGVDIQVTTGPRSGTTTATNSPAPSSSPSSTPTATP